MKNKSEVEEFVKDMESKGVLFTVKRGFTQVENTGRMSGADIMKMVSMDKSGKLTEYLTHR